MDNNSRIKINLEVSHNKTINLLEILDVLVAKITKIMGFNRQTKTLINLKISNKQHQFKIIKISWEKLIRKGSLIFQIFRIATRLLILDQISVKNNKINKQMLSTDFANSEFFIK
jgi:hypothetical protein